MLRYFWRKSRILPYWLGLADRAAAAADEGLEGVIGVEVGAEQGAVLGAPLLRRAAHERAGGLIENIFDLVGLAVKALGRLADQAGIVKRKPIAEVGVGYLDVEDVFFLADVKGGLKPGLVAFLVDPFFYPLEELLPRVKFIFILHIGLLYFHRNIHNCGKPCRLAEAASAKARGIIAFRKTDFKSVLERGRDWVRPPSCGQRSSEVEADPELGLEFPVGLDGEGIGQMAPAQLFDPFDMDRETQQEELDAAAVGPDGVAANNALRA